MTKRIQFDTVLLPAFEIFVEQSDRSGSVTKPKPGEIRGFQRIELNGFIPTVVGKQKLHQPSTFLVDCSTVRLPADFRRSKNEQLKNLL